MANKPYEMEKSPSECDLSGRKARGMGHFLWNSYMVFK